MKQTEIDETDGRYELQQMSGEPRPADDQLSSVVIDEAMSMHDSFFRQSHDSSENSLRALERTHHSAPKTRETSLEVLESTRHVSEINVDENDSTRNNTGPSRKTSPTVPIEKPANVPIPPTTSDSVGSTHPSLISLPPSLLETSNSAGDDSSFASFSDRCNRYRGNNLLLKDYFPHLRCVTSGSRHDKANITIFDFDNSLLQGHENLSIDFLPQNSAQNQDYTCSKLDECRQFICSVNFLPRVETRLVIVEDLGPSMIDLLGATFDLSPEFFEEHLHRSRYGGSLSHGSSPSTWRTSNLQKDYVSFAWFRLGESWKRDIEPEKWNHLLTQGTVTEMVTRGIDKQGKTSLVHHNFLAKTNTLRYQTEISMDPSGRLPDKVPCGLEERATLCCVESNSIQYGACRLSLECDRVNRANPPVTQ